MVPCSHQYQSLAYKVALDMYTCILCYWVTQKAVITAGVFFYTLWWLICCSSQKAPSIHKHHRNWNLCCCATWWSFLQCITPTSCSLITVCSSSIFFNIQPKSMPTSLHLQLSLWYPPLCIGEQLTQSIVGIVGNTGAFPLFLSGFIFTVAITNIRGES